MTNHEYLKQMSTDDFADWLCTQLWEDYHKGGSGMVEGMIIDGIRYHQIRNFLLMEHREEGAE